MSCESEQGKIMASSGWTAAMLRSGSELPSSAPLGNIACHLLGQPGMLTGSVCRWDVGIKYTSVLKRARPLTHVTTQDPVGLPKIEDSMVATREVSVNADRPIVLPAFSVALVPLSKRMGKKPPRSDLSGVQA